MRQILFQAQQQAQMDTSSWARQTCATTLKLLSLPKQEEQDW